jgi:rSAM/selenodomain-associated transferase 2
MTAPVSVVIPTLDEATRIGPCLAALTEGLMRGLITELVLADGGSADGIGAVADAAGARLVSARPGRGPQLAAGARAARGAWLLFLHADTVLSPGWAEAAARHMAERPERAGYFRLAFDSRHPMARVTAGWANLRARAFGMPFGDQGLLVPRGLYERVGGYPEIPLMEDMGLARRLRRALAPLDATAVTSAERYIREGWLRRGARNLSTQALWLAGVPPERLAARYRR